MPTVVISPFARRGHVSHQTFDHTSILKMIEWRWGLKPLTPRDQHAHNLATVLDFANPDTSTPAYAVDPFMPSGCAAADTETSGTEFYEWPALETGRPGGRMGPSSMRARTTPLLSGLAVLLALGGLMALAPARGLARHHHEHGCPRAARDPPAVRATGRARVRHQHREQGLHRDLGPAAAARRTSPGRLRAKGVLLDHYYATAHNSLPNYLAQISGQAPNLPTQADCQTFSAFTDHRARPGRSGGGQWVRLPRDGARPCRGS